MFSINRNVSFILNIFIPVNIKDAGIKNVIQGDIMFTKIDFLPAQIPIKSFQSYKVQKTQLEVKCCISMPSSTNLSKTDISKVVSTISRMQK